MSSPTQANIEHIVHALQADSNLNLADPSALAELARKARRLYFDKGEYIFKAGEESDCFYLVERGRVIMSKESSSGKSFTYLVATRGVTLSSITCFRPSPRMFSARVVEKASVISISSTQFRKWVLHNPAVASGILNTMGNLLDGAYTRILDLIDENVETRIFNVLCMLSTRIGHDLPLTNGDIAEMVGTSRETAARVISRLQTAGILSKSRGSITVLDKEQLDETASSPFFMI